MTKKETELPEEIINEEDEFSKEENYDTYDDEYYDDYDDYDGYDDYEGDYDEED